MDRLPDALRSIRIWQGKGIMVTGAIRVDGASLLVSAAGADALNYFQNYVVTGDAAYGSVGLRGTGVNGVATGNITISGVPCTTGVGAAASVVPCTTGGAMPVDVVAAYLYWETEETT